MSRPTPRVFLIRHGETEWSISGRHTGRTDIPLTPRGEEQVKLIGKVLVGPGRLIDPKDVCTAFVSPRQRAVKTFDLLFDKILPHWTFTEDVREWDYGRYEGLKPKEIQELSPGWSIWTDGCPDGESVAEMQARVDCLIGQVRKWHREYKEEGLHSRDVIVVAHGHFSRVFIARWLNLGLDHGRLFNAEPCGVALLSYNHDSLAEPALTALNLSRAVL
ncbi:hypothetical protein AX16_006482 [Volvariella volvacea WC 439]|nr:hypothetical protein AX16_006482 [Volvariella volvacea WC 439]